MGKEAKIGLAVIVILLITFGVVVAKKLTGTTDVPVQSSSAKQAQERSGEKPGAAQNAGKTKPPGPAASKPTVVEAREVSNRTPKPSPPVAQLSVISDGNQAKPGNATGQATPPFPMANPPRPVMAPPHSVYGNSPQSTAASQAPPTRPAPSQPAQAEPGRPLQAQPGRPWQLLPGRPPQATPVGMASPGDSLDLLPDSRAPRQTSPPVSNLGQGQPSLGVYPPGSVAFRQAPVQIQTSRYPNSSTPLPAAPVGQAALSEGDPSRDSQFDAGDLRREDGTYEVQPNDSYWIISEKLYGSGACFKALAEHNRGKVPQEDRLQVGDLISAPELAELEKMYPELCPKASRRETLRNQALAVSARRTYGGRTYTVEEGDTLFDIARYELGKASRWPEIHQLNRDVLGDDYDLLTPGMELVLPAEKEASGTVTRRPGPTSVYHR